MKNFCSKIGVTFIAIFCLSACSKPVSVDNTKEFEKAEQYYQIIKDNKYDYSNYQAISDVDKPVSTFIAINRFDSSIDYSASMSRYSVELPLKVDESKKYVLDYVSGGIDVNGYFVYNPFYASETFTTAFEDFAKNGVFNTTSISGRDVQLVRVKTIDATFIIYLDGTVGREYSDGIYYSTEKFSLQDIVLDYLSIKTYLPSGLENKVTDDHILFSATFNNKTIEFKGFKDFYKEGYTPATESYTFNSRIFDLSKMIDISCVEYENEYHLFLSRSGMIVKKLEYLGLNGSGDLYSLTSNNCAAYQIAHTDIDAEAVFALFE